MTQETLDGVDPPLRDDPSYPPLIRELAEVVERQLQDSGIESKHAAAVAETAAEHVRLHFGGSVLYWGKGEAMRQQRRRAAMWKDYCGGLTHAKLARKYGLCLQQCYRTLAIARREHIKRIQGDMFEQDGHGDKAGDD